MTCRPFQVALIAVAALVGSVAVYAAEHSAAPVELLCDVDVKADVITLSDLLPGSAPNALTRAGQQIVIGDAPQPGGFRQIRRKELERLLEDKPGVLDRVYIPPSVTVRRFHRELTRQELATAITFALGAPGSAEATQLAASDLRLSAPIQVTKDDPGLVVTRIEFDPLHRETHFRMWTSKEPQILPFYVTFNRGVKLPELIAKHEIPVGQMASRADFAVESRVVAKDPGPALSPVELAGLQARVPIKAGEAVRRSMFAAAVLAEPGKTARLIIEGPAYRISTTVIPLERGVLGQEIRVRDTYSQRVVTAFVVGRNSLRATP